MCGIAGVWREAGDVDPGLMARAMADRMIHRGPDDGGTWSDPAAGIGFGFRRLAIVDLSINGHQPMSSSSGRYQIVFNGEVYNHREIAAQLIPKGFKFRGHSDTEVILSAFEHWGVEASVQRFIGMFAMAVWDSETRSLSLIRDRMGIKPLFVYRRGGILAFASELKAFGEVPGFSRELDPEALAAYFRHLYVPAPLSIFRHVQKLLPGHIQVLRSPRDETCSIPYWSLTNIALQGAACQFSGDAEEAVDELESVLRDAVRLRMRADVPLGAFLSGGIDSTTVVALMQEMSARPVKTFTIGFDVREHNESSYASTVARHIGTDHNDIQLTGSDALGLIPRMPAMFDEPLADPSQVPTYLICSAARQSVTVAVSGDGGDELFGGYNRYRLGTRVIAPSERLPTFVRRAVATGLAGVSPVMWNRLHRGASAALRQPAGRLVGEKMHKVARLLRYSRASDMYVSLISAWDPVPMADRDGLDPSMYAILHDARFDLLQRMMLADQHGYLADDLLAKVDRTSMAVSLEVRVPILDHRVVELSWRMPDEFKIRNGTSKWALRQVLERRVPRALIDRPKVGFSVPLAEWLRGPLSEWAHHVFCDAQLERIPGLDVPRVRREWAAFQERDTSNVLEFWTILMLHEWAHEWGIV